MDALTPIETYSFHIIRDISDHNSHLYIGDIWKPDRDIFIIGCLIGLLCCTTNRMEMYLSISRNFVLSPEQDSKKLTMDIGKTKFRANYYISLKKDFLFYSQRDQRREPQGADDLLSKTFLPAGSGFRVSKDEPIYFKCAAMNKSGWGNQYDIFATLYWVEHMSQPHVSASAPIVAVPSTWKEL